jgi:hypothetical protein
MKPEGQEGAPIPSIHFEKKSQWGIPFEQENENYARVFSQNPRRPSRDVGTISIVSFDSPQKKVHAVPAVVGGAIDVLTSALTFVGRLTVMKPIELLGAGKIAAGLGYLAAEAAVLAAVAAAGGVSALMTFLAWAGATVAASVPAYAWQRLILKNYDQRYFPYPQQERYREDWQRLKRRKPRKKRGKKNPQLELDL